MRRLVIIWIILVQLSLINASATSMQDSTDYMSLFIEYRLSDLDSALFFAGEARILALEKGDSLTIVRAETAIGWVYQQKGSFFESAKHYQEALKISQYNNFRDREKFVLNNLGSLNYNFANYSEALKIHLESLELREQDGDAEDIAIACNNIGLVYYRIYDFERAIYYLKRAIDLKTQTGSRVESTLVNLGLCYTSLSQHDDALEYYQRVLRLCDSNCDQELLIEAYHGSGLSYLNTDDYEQAQENLQRAIDLSIEHGLSSRLAVALHSMSILKLRSGEINEALDLVNESQGICQEYNYKAWISKNLRQLGSIYFQLEDFRLAYDYQIKYDSLNSEILNEGIVKNMAKIQADYQERENRQIIENQDQEISRRNTLLYLSVVIIILISIILFILYRINQLRRKTNRELAEAKRTIEQQNNVLEEKVRERTKELKEANAALMKSNTDLDNFIYKTSHDIRGPLATLQGMCNVALIDIKDQKSRDYFDKIGKTAFRLNEILSKLLIINQINNSLIAQNPIDLEGLSKEIVHEQSFISGHNDVKVENEIGKLDNFQSDEVLLKIILGNLVSNAFKFHNSSNRVTSWVRLEAHRENGHLKLNVIDNGIGVDEKASSKIFEIFSRASEVSDTAGLGLYLVKLAVEKLHGKITHSKTDEGHTKFTVELPA